MLEVGNGGLSFNEEVSHFCLWSIMKAPLILGCDLNNITNEVHELLTNEEIIAIN
jgi:alpha-galactosidase